MILKTTKGKKPRECPQCGGVHPAEVLSCDCGCDLPSEPPATPAVFRFPLIIISVIVLVLGTGGAIVFDSLGILLIALGLEMLLVGRDAMWEYEKWRLKTWRGIEARRTGDWDALVILATIVLLVVGVIWLLIDLLR